MWQPIETAPDGVYVLIFDNGDIHVAKYYSRIKDWGITGDFCGMYNDVNPTHWMPLPEPPKEGL